MIGQESAEAIVPGRAGRGRVEPQRTGRSHDGLETDEELVWGVGARRHFIKPSLDAKLMEQVVERENVRRAWRQVKANRGAPGIDGQTIAETEIWLRTNWTTLRESLLSGTYQPLPLRRKAIPESASSSALRWGTAGCGPARRVVWGPGANHSRLPDYTRSLWFLLCVHFYRLVFIFM